MPKIAIVGAGVIGLSTAMHIHTLVPTADVTIFADKFYKDTTSIGAGALFRPTTEHIKGVDLETLRRWSMATFKFFSYMATSTAAKDTGHMVMSGYIFRHRELKNPIYKDIVFSFRELTREEMDKLKVRYEYGYQVTTVSTDMTVYLRWLMVKFKKAGGEVVNKHINSLEEFVGQYDVVVNCSGIFSRDLVGDKTVYPVKGHLLKVRAPWIKHFLSTEDGAYFIPGFDKLSMGGIRYKDDYSMEADPKDTTGIAKLCGNLWPSLKGIKIEKEWVNLRPHRDPLRVERETMKFGKGSLKVVHNYGHGGNGVTLSYGTGQDAARLTVQALMEAGSRL